jgi:hypothetical protein
MANRKLKPNIKYNSKRLDKSVNFFDNPSRLSNKD